jgi:hypothetical protein
MKRYSKFIAAIIGGILGAAVTKLGLPAELASDTIVQTLTTTLITAASVYIAPSNDPG